MDSVYFGFIKKVFQQPAGVVFQMLFE